MKKLAALTSLNIRDTEITDKVLADVFGFDFSTLKELKLSKRCGMQVDSS